MQKIKRINSPHNLSVIRVRNEPATSGLIIGSLKTFNPVYAKVERVKGSIFYWYEIKNEAGKIGYVASHLLTIDFEPVGEGRVIIDLHPDTIIIPEALQPIFISILEHLLDRVKNAKKYK